MKLAFKVGDKVKVTKGKLVGKEAAVVSLDKKNKRVKLDGLKVAKIKTKKGESKELHGSFHFASVAVIKAEPPKEEAKEEAAPAEAAADKAEEKTEEAKA